MPATPQVTLEDNKALLLQIGYLAMINGNGPFSGKFAHLATNQFNARQNIKDVAVGDHAYNGYEWGTVTAVSGDVTNGFSFTVKFSHTVMPHGQDPSTWNPARTQTYTAMIPGAEDVTGFPNNNAWQSLTSIGVLIVAPI